MAETFADLAKEFGYVPLKTTPADSAEARRLQALLHGEAGMRQILTELDAHLGAREDEPLERFMATLCNACHGAGGDEGGLASLVSIVRRYCVQSATHLDRQGDILSALDQAPEELFLPGVKKVFRRSFVAERLSTLASLGGLDVRNENRFLELSSVKAITHETQRRLAGPTEPTALPTEVEGISDEELVLLMQAGIPSGISLLTHHLFPKNGPLDENMFREYLTQAIENDALRIFMRSVVHCIRFLRDAHSLSEKECIARVHAVLRVSQSGAPEVHANIETTLQKAFPSIAPTAKPTAPTAEMRSPTRQTETRPIAGAEIPIEQREAPPDFLERVRMTVTKQEAQKMAGNLQRCIMCAKLLLTGDGHSSPEAAKKAGKRLGMQFHPDTHPGSRLHQAIFEFVIVCNELIQDGRHSGTFLEKWDVARQAATEIAQGKAEERSSARRGLSAAESRELQEVIDAVKDGTVEQKVDVLLAITARLVKALSETE